MNYSACSARNALPAGLDLPPDFKVTHVVDCTHYFFGMVHDRTLRVSEVTRSGSVTYTRSLTFSADAEGRPTTVFYLDYLWIFIFALYRIVSEWKLGTTLGKRILHMRVQPLGGGPMTAARAVKRTLMCFIPMYPFVLLLVLLIVRGPAGLLALGPYFFAIPIVGVVLVVVFLLNFFLALRHADLPWHDRWAGTEVVRTA